MTFLTILNVAIKIASDPATQAFLAKIKEWFAALTPAQQLAYASKYEAYQGYGCSHDTENCPCVPEDCKEIEALLLAGVSEAA